MIHLRDVLAEITLGHVEPYATQFVWRDVDAGYETKVQCDEVTVLFEMGTQFSREGKEYAFAIAMPGHYMLNGFTVTHSNSMVAGQLSYLRVLQTAGEAILDFCAQYAPDAIDVTGYDSQAGKDLQKTRIYRNLLHANAAKIASAGYRILDRSGKLYLVAANHYDATGVED